MRGKQKTDNNRDGKHKKAERQLERKEEKTKLKRMKEKKLTQTQLEWRRESDEEMKTE